MRQYRLLMIFVLLFCSTGQLLSVGAESAPAPRAGDEGVPGHEHWVQFRQAFPYHIQTLALHKESRTLIISEPPPHVTVASLREALQRYNPALNPAMSVAATGVGVDGWVKDVVLQLPPMGEAATRDAIDAVQQHVFHTTYKAYVMPLPARKPEPNSDNLDLRVSTAEVSKWLFQDGEPLSSLYGGGEQTADRLLQGKQAGVFFSKERGLVVWSFDRGKSVSDYLVEARQFALDSDIIVGAVSAGTQTLIIGRERAVPVEVLPPLRTETILQLSSVKGDQLAQSYERNHIFAGSLRGGEDWAPIYLSEALIDTEYGSLLNITDQLLKRWSMNGQIEYKNFKYPDPQEWGKSWCFSRPLFFEAGATNLTFNWNTKGVGYTTKIGAREFFALNRSGSLPTSYLEGEEQKPDYSTYEETGYRCFAQFGDPNLARVVQYAALYQIFQKFPVRRARDADRQTPSLEPKDDALTQAALEILKIFVVPTLPQAAWINSSLSPAEQRLFRQHRAAFAEVYSSNGEAGLRALAFRLTHSLSSAEIEYAEGVRKRLIALTPVQQVRVLTPLTASDLELNIKYQSLKRWTAALDAYDKFMANPAGAGLSQSQELFNKVGRTDRAVIKDRYSAQVKPAGDVWIHTPSVVISRPVGRLADNLEGGHNVRAATTSFEVSPAVPPGSVRLRRTGSRLTFLVNPADAGRIPSLVRKAALLSEGGTLTPQRQARIRQELQASMGGGQPPVPPRPKNLALAMGPGGPGGPGGPPPSGRGFGGGGDGGWRPELIPVVAPDEVRAVAKYGDSAFLVEKKQGAGAEGFEYTIITADGKVIKAYSTPSAIDAVVGLGRSTGRENSKVAFHLKGFNADEAQGFLYNADFRMKNNRLTGFTGGKEPATFRAQAADYRLPGVEVGDHSIRQVAAGRYKGLFELQVNFDVPVQAEAKAPLKVRLQMLYRNAIADRTVTGVKNAIKSFFAKPVAPDAKINEVIVDLANELRALNPDARNILTVWEEDTRGVLIVEIRQPGGEDGDFREDGGSE